MQHLHYATHALCNTCILQHLHSKHALCSTCIMQHMHHITHSLCNACIMQQFQKQIIKEIQILHKLLKFSKCSNLTKWSNGQQRFLSSASVDLQVEILFFFHSLYNCVGFIGQGPWFWQWFWHVAYSTHCHQQCQTLAE